MFGLDRTAEDLPVSLPYLHIKSTFLFYRTDRKCCTTSCITIHLRDDNSIDATFSLKFFCHIDSILSCHGINDQNTLEYIRFLFDLRPALSSYSHQYEDVLLYLGSRYCFHSSVRVLRKPLQYPLDSAYLPL